MFNQELAQHITWRQVFDLAYRFLTALMVPLLIWLGSMLRSIERATTELDRRVTAIEANRFTSVDGLAIWQEMATRPTRQELEGKLTRLEQTIGRIESKLDNHMARTQ